MHFGAPHSKASVSRSLVIADIVSSTALYESLGDDKAKGLIESSLNLMSDCVRSAGGRVIKTLGDGLLASFTGADAAQAALDIAARMDKEPTGVRVAAHLGEVIESNEDIFGDAVNTVARIAELARENEVLISEALFAHASSRVRELARSVPSVAVKGKHEPLRLFSILDRDDGNAVKEMTYVSPSEGHRDTAIRRVRIVTQGRTYELTGAGALQIGRSPDCEVQVTDSKASRKHAQILYRNPEYVLADMSTNGTYLLPENGQPVHLNRRETVLFGRGRIYVGSHPEMPNATWLDFEVS